MYQDFLIEFSQLTIKLKKRRKNAYVCGCVHVCVCLHIAYAYAYVNLNFCPTRFIWYHAFYIGYSDPALFFCFFFFFCFVLFFLFVCCFLLLFFYLYKLNHTLCLLLQKNGQSAHASAARSVSPIAVTILVT